MNKNVIIIIVAVIGIALYGGYLWGLKAAKENGAVGQSPSSTMSPMPTPTPEIDTGYQNPFEGVKVNPFR